MLHKAQGKNSKENNKPTSVGVPGSFCFLNKRPVL